MKRQEIRVRIAPSPTGFLHMGTARTALFNFLFAKKHGGTFILRIEDTDKERSKAEFEKDIIENLHWLGITWDEGPSEDGGYRGAYGPYRQSERNNRYQFHIERLLSEQHAYYCFCSADELAAVRESMLAEGIAPKYSGKCRNLSEEEVSARLKRGESSAIRFKVPETTITFTDLIRGKIAFDAALSGDIVVAKTISEPFYNLAVVIDDEEMKISHVIRGEDHIANTPKQIALIRALGFSEPHYAHLPLILDPDRSKMSKRHSATSVAEYRTAGYLRESLVNFLALLGWHPQKEASGEEREIFSLGELIERFDIERIQKGGAIFNIEKLDWLNGQYLKNLTNDELLDYITEITELPAHLPKARLLKIVEISKERMKKLKDFFDLADFFFKLPDYPRDLLMWKHATIESTVESLRHTADCLDKIPAKDFKKDVLIEALQPLTNERGRGEVLWPLRVALSGKEASPGPFEIMEILGKIESLARISSAIQRATGGQHLAI